ncbi:E3 ubiquitin-protein ligase TRIM65 isoform X2 [Mesoplodon densirostris]|uniref:E3 ubiquitin-protein ligase TRIM65 isoform X2 n=1 Tax=Mesoplodon densirostris TaxID=48708 RepID=UPI0028DCF840|nr:E3 ubiquitin-protein ligase TRIM65 isoform X2 [Mesoplodon densirostris]
MEVPERAGPQLPAWGGKKAGRGVSELTGAEQRNGKPIPQPSAEGGASALGVAAGRGGRRAVKFVFPGGSWLRPPHPHPGAGGPFKRLRSSARRRHGRAEAGGPADLCHLPGALPGPGDAALRPQLLQGLYPGLVEPPREGVPQVLGALPRQRRAAPQRGSERRAGGPVRPAGARARARPRPRRPLPPAREAARAFLPHRGPLRVQRVHRARVSPPRADAAGRRAPRARADPGPLLSPVPWWAPQAQLRATLEVTQQQATQAESQLQELQQRSSQIQSSACTLTSVISGKFSRLLQALEMQRDLALRDIEVAKTQALEQARDEKQRLQGHLEALSCCDHRICNLLEQLDDRTFLQESQLLVPPGPLGPLTLPHWDEDEQLGGLKESLSQLCALLLEEGGHPGAPAEAADFGSMEAPDPLAPVPSLVCPLRRKLWQNYRNLTFDPVSANRHFYLSRQDQRVKHCRKPRGPDGPGSFELWQVQCAQSFQAGRHYWEVRASNHSVTLGVAYSELTRHKLGPHTDNIGRGPSSWGLCIQEDSTQAWHNGEAQRLPGVSGRLLGMDLDLTSGCLTFYSLEPETQPLYTFHAIFARPLHPVFWLLEGRTLTLCHRPEAELPPGLQEEASGLS